jgi:hypothetical protein
MRSFWSRTPSNQLPPSAYSNIARRISVVGQNRTFGDVRQMSALSPETGHRNSVSKCPLCAKRRHRPLIRSPRLRWQVPSAELPRRRVFAAEMLMTSSSFTGQSCRAPAVRGWQVWPGNNRPGAGTKETMELQKLINHCADALSEPRCATSAKLQCCD